MISILITSIISILATIYVQKYLEQRQNTITQFFDSINIIIQNTETIAGINFDRHILELHTQLSFLQFKNLEPDINKFLNKKCFLHKQCNKYIIDINNNRHKHIDNNLITQTNCYNSYNFTGKRLLINNNKNILIIHVDIQFFIDSILQKTTDSTLLQYTSIHEICQMIHQRKHAYKTEKQTSKVFAILHANQVNSKLRFILKYCKSVNIFIILIGNQNVINDYGKEFDCIFATSIIGRPICLKTIKKYTPIEQLNNSSDIILLQKNMLERIYIPSMS